MVGSALFWGEDMKRVRCAIYTRKSSDEGLDQSFNSLDAQREACEAYIHSQKHEGWKVLPIRYDDGGASGGNMDRKALQKLLGDIDEGRVDMVVVYKIDRLTRSLADFAKLVERLDAAGASFVSVTQQFNTSTSMGRLTLNVLLSFAQFEREVTAERIRDKIAASKKKGLWMGGLVPLGYDKAETGLVVNQNEAGIVRSLFEQYLVLKDVTRLKAWADRQELRTKSRTWKDGTHVPGKKFAAAISISCCPIRSILARPIIKASFMKACTRPSSIGSCGMRFRRCEIRTVRQENPDETVRINHCLQEDYSMQKETASMFLIPTRGARDIDTIFTTRPTSACQRENWRRRLKMRLPHTER